MFLTAEEVADLTGLKRPTAQVHWLRVNGWPVETDAAGRPKLLRAVVEARADMARLLRDGIVNAPCPTPAQWRQLQDFAKGYLAGADSASVEGDK